MRRHHVPSLPFSLLNLEASLGTPRKCDKWNKEVRNLYGFSVQHKPLSLSLIPPLPTPPRDIRSSKWRKNFTHIFLK
jgi:hypothetical protein